MKISHAAFFALLLVGCTSTHQNASLTAERAKSLSMRLANDKASTVYHCQPFNDGQPASFVASHWIWTDQRGFGHCDLQATVELAADGATNSVDLALLDNQIEIR